MASFQDVRQYLSGQDTLEPLLQQLVGGSNMWDPSSFLTSESGNQQNYLWQPSQDALSQLAGYDFNWSPTGYRNTGTLTATKDGQQVGSWSQKDDSDMKSLGEFGMLAGAGFGGLGLLGAGPLGGALGGAGGAAADPIGAYLTTGGVDGSLVGGLGGAGGAAGAAGGGSGLLGSLGGSGGLGGLLSNGQMLAGLAGAAAGFGDSKDQTTTAQNKMDPRMDALVYGQGGLLGSANDWFQQNKGGNPLMQQGAQTQANFFSNPAYAQQFGQLRDQGLGLLGGKVAKNPFMPG